MPLERIDSYFNGAVESYDERLKRSAEDEDGYIRRTAEFFPKKEHLHILDIGIGTGTGLTAILEQNPTIYVDGIDCADKDALGNSEKSAGAQGAHPHDLW